MIRFWLTSIERMYTTNVRADVRTRTRSAIRCGARGCPTLAARSTPSVASRGIRFLADFRCSTSQPATREEHDRTVAAVPHWGPAHCGCALGRSGAARLEVEACTVAFDGAPPALLLFAFCGAPFLIALVTFTEPFLVALEALRDLLGMFGHQRRYTGR